MTQYKEIKFKVKLGFCLAIFSIIALALFQIFSTWKDNLRDVSLTIEKNVRIANLLIDDALIDGSKFLDIAKVDLINSRLIDSRNGESLEQSLKKSVSKFKISSWFHAYGNLLFVNAEGDVLAQTGGPLTKKINVADRPYFQSLKNNPSQNIVVSHIVIARSNGQKVFHMATPFVDSRGNFNGLLVIQINAQKFEDSIIESLDDGFNTMGLYSQNGDLIFSLNDDVTDFTKTISRAELELINSKSGSEDIFTISQNGIFGFENIVAHSAASNMGLIVVGEVSTKSVWTRTLSWALKFLLLVFLSCIILSCFAYRLLASINEIEAENQLAIHDSLTHLPNRRYFDEIFPKIQGECRRSHTPLSVLFIDIDKFKNFNDQYGHECGDKALRIVAHAILSIKKRPLDFFCRWGGEEFLFILPNTDQKGAIHYAEEILHAVNSRQVEVEGGVVTRVTVSIGIATDPEGIHNLSDDLIKSADAAMYRAKLAGRNRYEI